jgi:tetratricopeptide (TPR) repeat protein
LRKAEVLYALQSYPEALETFQKCFQLSRNEKEQFHDLAKKCKREMAKESSLNDQYPFVGAAIGKYKKSKKTLPSNVLRMWDNTGSHSITKLDPGKAQLH